MFKNVRNTVELAPETQHLKPRVIISRVGWAVWLASLDFPHCNIPTMGQDVCIRLSWGLYCCGRTQQQHEEERIHIAYKSQVTVYHRGRPGQELKQDRNWRRAGT